MGKRIYVDTFLVEGSLEYSDTINVSFIKQATLRTLAS